MDRKHRATGRKPGGVRPGSGRPAGSKNTLELGEVRALKAIGLRIPEGASEKERAFALHTESRIIDVMSGDVSPALAMAVLKAATTWFSPRPIKAPATMADRPSPYIVVPKLPTCLVGMPCVECGCPPENLNCGHNPLDESTVVCVMPRK